MQHTFVAPDRNALIGMPTPTEEQRLRICRDLANVLAFLHSDDLKITFGDLKKKNELFRLDAEPHVMLIDCDAARVRGDMGQQPNTPDWIPPTGELLSVLSDRYKFGLFVLRCLTPGDQGSTRTDPAAAAGVLDATGMGMLRDAITEPPKQRPSTLEWFQYLSRCLGEPLDPPTLGALALDRTFVAAGEPLTVRWTAQEAETVEFIVLERGIRSSSTAPSARARWTSTRPGPGGSAQSLATAWAKSRWPRRRCWSSTRRGWPTCPYRCPP